MANCGGAWKNTEEVEDSLTLDELLMISEQVNKTRWHNWRFHAAIQGIEMDDDPFDNTEDRGDDDLPPELLEREREWQRKKAEMLESKEAERQEFESMGLGYIKK